MGLDMTGFYDNAVLLSVLKTCHILSAETSHFLFLLQHQFVSPNIKRMWIVFALLAALSAGVAVVLSKAGLKDTDSTLAFAIQSILILIISWTAAFWQKDVSSITEIDKRTWIFLIAAGVATTLSSLLTFRALKLGEAALVSSLERSSLVFAVAFAAIFLHEPLNWKVILGVILMTGGAVLIGLSRQNGD